MKQKRRLRALLGAALAAVLFTGAAGASAPPGFPAAEPGRTTVAVQTADMDSKNLSFTAPLYLTVAAGTDAQGRPRVVVPDSYTLKNTTGTVSGGSFPAIAVTGVTVTGVPGGTWSMRGNPQSAEDICLSIGGLTLPDVNAGSGTPVPADITASDNCFYDSVSGMFRPIAGGPALSLPIEGRLAGSYLPEERKAAAQFRVTYTVSLLDGGGKPIGVYYEGPAKENAVAPGP